MDEVLSDVRFALRTFARRPLILGIAAASLALGIGASSAMFSVVDAVLLRPLPFPEPERLVSIYPTWPGFADHPTLAGLAERGTFSWPEFWDLAENQTAFEAIAAYRYTAATLAGEGTPERLDLGEVTPDFFRVLGVGALRGTLFPDDLPTDGRVIVLSEGLWRDRFGADPDIIGGTVTLDDEPYTVLGVLPPHAGTGTMRVDGWLPRSGSSAEGNRGNHNLGGAVARLAAGFNVAQARDEAARILSATTPPDHGGVHGASVFRLHGDRTRRARPALLVLIAASVLLLGVGCANVAAILMGAGLERKQEIAVRGALGAHRRRITRQLLTESLALAAVGGAGGLAVATVATRGLLLLAPAGFPRIEEAVLDIRVVAFATLISAASGVVFGLLPALSLAREQPASALTSSRGTTAGQGRGQSLVVVGELALATVLLVGGALLGRTLLALNRVDPGFAVEELLAVRLAPPWQRFTEEDPDAWTRRADAYFQRIVEEVSSLPGVKGVAVTSNLPLTGERGNNDVIPEGWDPEGETLLAERRFVSSGYFSTLGIPIVEGREFDATDEAANAPQTVVVSQGLARRAWPGESALGKRLDFWGDRSATVVGVAADVHDELLESPTTLAFYAPFRQFGAQTGNLLVRTEGDPGGMATAVRERIWAADPAIAIPSTETYEALVAEEVSEERYRARLIGVFALLAGLFAAMGVYGVTARAVARRTREIGIRVALGARPGRVLRRVLGQGLRLSVWGAVLGLVAAHFATRVLEGMLYGVERNDPLTLIGIALLVCLLGALATLPPGRRATRVDPMVALRAE